VPSSYLVANTNLAKKYIYYMDYIAFNIISSFTQEIELLSRRRRCNGHITQSTTLCLQAPITTSVRQNSEFD